MRAHYNWIFFADNYIPIHLRGDNMSHSSWDPSKNVSILLPILVYTGGGRSNIQLDSEYIPVDAVLV